MAYSVNNKKIVENTIALYFRTAITMVIAFFTARVTLQILGSEDYGLNNLVGGIVALFSFINASMGTAVQRFLNIEMGKKNFDKLGRIYGVGVYLHCIVALITLLICEIFALLYLEKMNIPTSRMTAAHVVFQISVLSMVLNIINVPNYAILKAHEEFSKMAYIEIIQAFLRLGVLYLLYTINFDKLIVYSSLNLVVSLYYVISIFIYARKYEEVHHRICRDKELAKQMIGFISLLLITVLAELGRNQGLVMLINLFFGLTINAAYAIAVQISSMLNSFVINIKQPIIPQMMASYGAKDQSSMHHLIFLGTKVAFIMLLMMSMPIIFETTQLLTLWLDNPPQHTSRLMILVLVNVNIASFTYFLYQGVHATGNIKRQQILYSSLYILNVGLMYLGFTLGLNFDSALWITIAISIIQNIVNLFLAHYYYHFNIKNFCVRCILPCLGLAVFTSLFLWGVVSIMSPSLIRLGIVIIADILIIALLGFYMLFDSAEKRNILTLFHLTKLAEKY